MMITKFKNLAFLLLSISIITISSCRENDAEDDGPILPIAPETVTGTITSNKTLTADRVWILKGYVYVNNGATLTVEPGTVIKGDISEKGALIIERGSKLMANGTAAKPIVFTSGVAAGSRAPGDWGGIVILGRATTNKGTEVLIEGGINKNYGGTIDNDNSGVLRYVRIEYAGISAFQSSEINGLTLGGVGNGTVLENIQVSFSNDDAYEFFGGTVNAKNLVAFATSDDDFDFDFGYRGSIQFGLALRNPAFGDTDQNNGIECDNDGSSTNATPTTRPVLSNFTLIGPNTTTPTKGVIGFGNRWRRSTNFVFNNSIMMAWPKAGFSIESAATLASYVNNTSEFKNNLVQALALPYSSDQTGAAATMQTKAESEGNVTVATVADVKLTSPFTYAAPNLLPQTGSPALAGTFAATTGATATTYRGAFGTTDWTTGWANWDPQNKTY
ncbi:MAG TPA: hypothetical protein VGB63_17570 [Pedobacter sp.]|jgi:hypothetical protein